MTKVTKDDEGPGNNTVETGSPRDPANPEGERYSSPSGLTGMRLWTLLSLTALAGAALAQRDPYAEIAFATRGSLSNPRVILDVGGSVQVGDQTPKQLRQRIYIQGLNTIVDAYVDDVRQLLIVADGKKVWRYDPVKKEYTFLDQPGSNQLDQVEAMRPVFGIAAAWARTDMQRPLRLLALSSRWLLDPHVDFADRNIRLSTRVDMENNDWRGSEINFYMAEDGSLDHFTIQERLAMPDGKVKQTNFVGTFVYPPKFDFPFTFVPPKDAKPAADLPIRIG